MVIEPHYFDQLPLELQHQPLCTFPYAPTHSHIRNRTLSYIFNLILLAFLCIFSIAIASLAAALALADNVFATTAWQTYAEALTQKILTWVLAECLKLLRFDPRLKTSCIPRIEGPIPLKLIQVRKEPKLTARIPTEEDLNLDSLSVAVPTEITTSDELSILQTAPNQTPSLLQNSDLETTSEKIIEAPLTVEAQSLNLDGPASSTQKFTSSASKATTSSVTTDFRSPVESSTAPRRECAHGLNAQQIDAYTVIRKPKRTESKLKRRAGALISHLHGETESTCTVCDKAIGTDRKIRWMPCLCYFHATCLEQRLANSVFCPQCLQPVM